MIKELVLAASLLTPEQHQCALDRMVEWAKSPDTQATMSGVFKALETVSSVCGIPFDDAVDAVSADELKAAVKQDGGT